MWMTWFHSNDPHFLPEVDVHLPVPAVEVAVVEFKLVGASVPDVTVTLGGGKGVLGPALYDPSTLVLVAVPHHQAAGGEPAADELNSLVDVSAFIPVKQVLNNCVERHMTQCKIRKTKLPTIIYAKNLKNTLFKK